MASLQFSDTTNRTGIVEMIELRTGTQSSTSSSYPLKVKTVDVNSALDNFISIAQKVSPSIKFDDTNYATEPKYTINLVSGTQAYTFTTDALSAQITAVDRVEIITASGAKKRLQPLNRDNITDIGLGSYEAVNGEPNEYEIVGKTINLYPAPNYNSTNGLILYTERTGSYFVSTDTTKVAGIPNLFHEYLVIRPSYYYCAKKGLPQAKFLQIEVDKMEETIGEYYRNSVKDSQQENVVMTAEFINAE